MMADREPNDFPKIRASTFGAIIDWYDSQTSVTERLQLVDDSVPLEAFSDTFLELKLRFMGAIPFDEDPHDVLRMVAKIQVRSLSDEPDHSENPYYFSRKEYMRGTPVQYIYMRPLCYIQVSSSDALV